MCQPAETTDPRKAFIGKWESSRKEGLMSPDEKEELIIEVTGRHWVLDKQSASSGDKVSRIIKSQV